MFYSLLVLFNFIMFEIVNTEVFNEGNKIDNIPQTLISPIQLAPEIVNNLQRKTGFNWPMGIVPYNIDTTSYDFIISHRIRMAMKSIERASCVVFRHLDVKPGAYNQFNWLHFTNPNQERDCVHEPIIEQDGEIVIVLGFECMQRREVIHALLHALGFKDEVSHPHRDQYIRILWENLQPKYRHLFRIQLDAPYKVVEYDPMSIMHFHDRAFSTNGGATIAPLVPGLLINPSDNLSQLDVMKLRLSFGHECNKRKVGDLLATCKHVFHKDNNPGNNDNGRIQTEEDNSNVYEEPRKEETDFHLPENNSEDPPENDVIIAKPRSTEDDMDDRGNYSH